ncbi:MULTISPECIES: dipeptide epimerase [Aminobacterium]|jgi:L-alanine-DL-glutamate epimerase-like enolase superfamily enzyme|uniref:dipeptide epimerase n=1 Tax=Aminobacterium TaxID=81466 RepID=UPI00257BE30A|nr:dipeptide epimerase [Aminobacterium sp. UBA4987]
MRIQDIYLRQLSIPLKKTFKTALRSVSEVTTNVVVIETDNGVCGYGEAPPTAVITGDTNGAIYGAIQERIRPLLIGKDIDNLGAILDVVDRAILHNTSAKAAIDIALHDLWGKMLNQPLYALLGGIKRKVVTDYTISVNAPDEMVEDSLEAVGGGYTALKIKVGTDFHQDMVRLKEIRSAVGNKILLRVDANQGWTPKEAIRIIHFMEDNGLNIELVEQPVIAYDFEGLKMVTDTVNTLILADEAVFSPRDAFTLLTMRAADLLNIKLMKTGGIRNALAICAMARSAGVECMIGAMMESKISVTAACHLATAMSVITRADLDPPILCSADPVEGGAQYDGPAITLSKGPGLGITKINGLKPV